ncbi:MAG: EAL and HDOD domain-containing protein [Oscillospiraceae bacterium]
MDSYIVRQALMDSDQKTFGYEILYADSSFGEVQTDDSTAANAIENFLSSMNSEKFTSGKIAFLTFTQSLLEKNIPKMFETSKLVVQIEDSLITNPMSHSYITKLKQSGYKIAVIDFEFAPRFFGILDIVDYIKINFSREDPSLENLVKIGMSFGKKVIAYNIETAEQYERAKALGCSYFQGSYLAQKTSSTVKKANHLQSNFFLLMIAVTKDEPDIDEIEEIISRDVSLTYSLLKLVNSAYFALRNRARSVKQALVILGIGQLKQWIYLLSFKQDDGSQDELVKLSFLRAMFASELVVLASNMPISRSEGYLLGMFSTLDKLMAISLDEALEQLPISDEIKNGLLKGEGKAGTLLSLVLSYEKADWRNMSIAAEELGISSSLIAQKYFECVESVNDIWNGLTQANDELVD